MGISPEGLGPDKINKLLELSSKIQDPASISSEFAEEVIRTLGITLNSKSKPKITEKIPRNSKCPCGSGRKWKKCCGEIRRSSSSGESAE